MVLFPSPVVSNILIQEGDKCGATFIDREFRKWLELRLGRVNFGKLTGEAASSGITWNTIVEPRMVDIMRDFEITKRSFAGIGSPSKDHIALPHPLNSLNNPANGIENGEICITE